MAATILAPLPQHPSGVDWPTEEWPLGKISEGVDQRRLLALLDHAFAHDAPEDTQETHAVVIVQHDRLLVERYWKEFTASDSLPSWSMAKSITHALVGLAVRDGKMDITVPASVPEWQSAGDPRHAITLDQLLRMSSGLAFVEEYFPDRPSDVIPMLWGDGKNDVARFAASMPLAHQPGEYWSYSSGTTNIVSRAVSIAMNAHGPAFETFMKARLFDPLGIRSALPKFDTAGTFIGSSFCFATARDFARFGLLYLRDGIWNGERLLPAGWIDYARTPTWQQPTLDGPYGAHWWLDMAGAGTFSANGYDGQFIVVLPHLDMVIVRLGSTRAEKMPNVIQWIRDVAGCFTAGA